MILKIIFILILLTVLAVLVIGYLYPQFFLMNDVTTTPDDPPEFHKLTTIPENLNRDMSFSEDRAALVRKYYAYLHPLYLNLSPHDAFIEALKAATEMPHWWIVNVDKDAGRIEAVASTPHAGFKDDVVIEIRPSGQGSMVHVRSKSRLGKGDFGANAHRIEEYLHKIEKR